MSEPRERETGALRHTIGLTLTVWGGILTGVDGVPGLIAYALIGIGAIYTNMVLHDAFGCSERFNG